MKFGHFRGGEVMRWGGYLREMGTFSLGGKRNRQVSNLARIEERGIQQKKRADP